MTSPVKPLILLVTGAWHLPPLYEILKQELGALGYDFVCPKLATMGADSQGLDWRADVELLRRVAEPLFEGEGGGSAGREVVLLAHSYGGIPACAATEGFTVRERSAAGKKGGFRSIIYMAAFALPQRGMDLLQAFGGTWAPWMNAAEPYTKNQVMIANEKAKFAFYNDLPAAEAQARWNQLVPHSQDAMETPVDFVAADLTIPKGYIVCELDQGRSCGRNPPIAREKQHYQDGDERPGS
ncbi:hypothetical protein BX600DRAFT_437723 [Xylariales sp. PMI_506]|nr:hypothetical protein BX600DRAFT_437723 [Xylariales sp. PMI_506]